MGHRTTRRLMALALGAIVSAGSGIASSKAAHAGGDCPPGWNAPVKKQDSAGRTFTWRAGATWSDPGTWCTSIEGRTLVWRGGRRASVEQISTGLGLTRPVARPVVASATRPAPLPATSAQPRAVPVAAAGTTTAPAARPATTVAQTRPAAGVNGTGAAVAPRATATGSSTASTGSVANGATANGAVAKGPVVAAAPAGSLASTAPVVTAAPVASTTTK